MREIQRLINLDWDEIGHALLITAAGQIADAVRLRTEAPDATITIEQSGQDRLRISIKDPDLIRLEQGDDRTPPNPFLAPTAYDRV